MQKTLPIFAAAALAAILSLSACDRQPKTITADNVADPQATELANAAPVELPPAIAASRTYRCKDNSLVYIDFYTNNTARVRMGSREAAPTTVTAPEAGGAYTAEGYSVSANEPTVTLTAPGKGSQSCKA